MYTEKQLIAGCKKRKKEYQEATYKVFYAFAMSICLRYTYSRDDAMEVLQDGFLKVFTKIDSFDEKRSFKSWIHTIFVNTSLDHYRANKKHLVLVDTAIDELDVPEEEFQFEQTLKSDDILKLFNQLPEMHRMVFNLYEFEGYSHDEIAERFGITAGTSRSQLSRAKKQLKKLYFEQYAKEKV